MALTLVEARARAAVVSDVSYDLELDLRDRSSFGCRAVVRFTSTAPETFLELARAEDLIVSGAEASYDGHRIQLSGLDTGAPTEVVVTARLPYVTDGEGMHAFTDPADGAAYAGAYCGMDLAQRVFPCFDQNDLKAPIALRVQAPTEWTVVANGAEVARDDGSWTFATTLPIPPALFIVVGGPYRSVRWEHAGLPFAWHVRQSLGPALDRDADWLRRTTEACFDHYATLFTEPYPFDSYDQVFVPGLNWGAQEMPGAISYRDEFLRVGEPTEPERRDLAMVIAHEMAHMWFGDLVTMTWWEDTWLQESFADYLGFRVAEDAVGMRSTFTDFTVGWKPRAYLADVRRSTHPVAPLAEEVPDVDVAGGNFDALSYAKGNAVLRQLVTWLGDDQFFAGVNDYLSRHRFGNATLDDFVAALDAASDRDVRTWAATWLRTTGFDTLGCERRVGNLVVSRAGSRSHRVRVTSYDDALREIGSTVVDLGDEPVTLPAAPAVLVNAGGETYARLDPDPESWELLTRRLSGLGDPAARGVVWATAFDRVGTGAMTVADFLGMLTRHLPVEDHASTVVEVLDWVRTTLLARHVSAEQAPEAVAHVAATCAAALAQPLERSLTVSWTRSLALSSPDADRLESWLAAEVTAEGVPVDPTLRWLALHRLAALGAVDAERLARERAADGTVEGVLGEARALAARPTAEAKTSAWAALVEDQDISNRAFSALAEGLWDIEQAALVAPFVERYTRTSVDLAVARGPSFAAMLGRAFPRLRLTHDQVDAITDELARDDVPTALRRSWEDAVDDALRALG
jgi:aminopeptidase N